MKEMSIGAVIGLILAVLIACFPFIFLLDDSDGELMGELGSSCSSPFLSAPSSDWSHWSC